MNDQLTREELAEQVAEGNGRTLILIVCTRYTTEDCATNYVRPTLQQKGWMKVGGEGNYKGLRGVYARFVPCSNHQDFLDKVEIFRRETADAIQNRLQDYSKDEEIAEAHFAFADGLLYTNEALELLQLPRL